MTGAQWGQGDRIKASKMRDLFFALSQEFARELQEKGITEEEILSDFQVWRKAKRDKAAASGTEPLS